MRSSLFTHPDCGEQPLLQNSLRPTPEVYFFPSPSIVVHGSFLPVNNDHYGTRADRLFLPGCQRFIPTPLLRRGVGRVVCSCSHKLSARLSLCPETSVCFSDS
ncbi:MAG: hypothetical protein HDR49_00215 [Bacteroides sp.]|nr:hypothetical protein [Bacteroides sp.]